MLYLISRGLNKKVMFTTSVQIKWTRRLSLWMSKGDITTAKVRVHSVGPDPVVYRGHSGIYPRPLGFGATPAPADNTLNDSGAVGGVRHGERTTRVARTGVGPLGPGTQHGVSHSLALDQVLVAVTTLLV